MPSLLLGFFLAVYLSVACGYKHLSGLKISARYYVSIHKQSAADKLLVATSKKKTKKLDILSFLQSLFIDLFLFMWLLQCISAFIWSI